VQTHLDRDRRRRCLHGDFAKMKGFKGAKLVLEARQPRLEASVLSDGICNSADGETENHSK
jgi:hypothetical protein